MVDWTKSMKQTYEYYEVDPISWKDKKLIDSITSCTIDRDSGADTLGSANISIVNMLGECYIRVYLVTIQNGETERHPLGTFLVQTPSSEFDGKVRNVTMDAYTPLIELKENPVPLGYTLLKDENIMHNAYLLTRERARAPVIETTSDKVLQSDFVSNTEDSYATYISDLIAQAKYEFGLDDLGRIIFLPKQNSNELQPRYTFNDDNSSILLPSVSLEHDLYGIPNVVEVICSTGNELHYARVVNDDPNSPTSTVQRGREIIKRITDPELPGIPTAEQVDEYAESVLKEASSIEYQVTFQHGYCPVRIGDCVRLNYVKAGLVDIKAKIISQSINCTSGCTIQETATFSKKLWK